MEDSNMNALKKYTVWGIIIVTVLGTVSHFVYDWSGQNPLAALFFPVNESTWEHMKLIFFPMLAYVLVAAPHLKEKYPNILPASFTGILFGVFLIPVLFYSYSGILGFHLAAVDIGIFIVSVIMAFLLANYLIRSDKVFSSTGIAWIYATVIILFLAFLIFSFYPPSLGIFTDPTGS